MQIICRPKVNIVIASYVYVYALLRFYYSPTCMYVRLPIFFLLFILILSAFMANKCAHVIPVEGYFINESFRQLTALVLTTKLIPVHL